ncbi:MAG: ABC transporter permease, partial [Saprospiraceae bacterium]
MWLAICKFEILYKLRRPETYVYFVFLLAVSVFAFDFIYQGKEMGPLHSSSPQVIGKIMAVLSGFFMIINSMIMGVPVLKDYGHKMESLIFVSPIQKWEYLLGRYLGSFVVLFAVYFAILLGMMIGDWMPWREAGTIGENYLLNYLHTYAIVVLPVLFFGGSIFFVTGMLSRKMIVVYTQGLVFFLILLISVKIENPLVSGVMDPFSHMAIGQLMSAVSLEEAANQLIPIRGVLLYNRVFWCGLGIAALLYGYFTFSFGVDFNQKRKTVPSYDRVVEAPSSGSAKLSPGFTSYGLRTSAAQLVAHSFFYFYTILRKPSFWAIVICGIVTILVNSVNLGLTY